MAKWSTTHRHLVNAMADELHFQEVAKTEQHLMTFEDNKRRLVTGIIQLAALVDYQHVVFAKSDEDVIKVGAEYVWLESELFDRVRSSTKCQRREVLAMLGIPMVEIDMRGEPSTHRERQPTHFGVRLFWQPAAKALLADKTELLTRVEAARAAMHLGAW